MITHHHQNLSVIIALIALFLPQTLSLSLSMGESKPSLPASYTVPKVWQPPVDAGGKFASINRPTAGARSQTTLPKGDHQLQLYSLGTPNGQKVTILLEELGLEYDAYSIDMMKEEQFGSAFVEINPNSKIPALLDHLVTPPQRVFESGSILLYLAEKEQKLIPKDSRKRTECMNWLMWQMGTAPYLGGGFGHFYAYAPVNIEYAIDRFAMETKRIVDVLDKHLGVDHNEYMCGDEYSIADIAIYPWIKCLSTGYHADEFLQLDGYKNVKRWMTSIEERPAVQRGMRVNGYGPDAVKERHSPADFETPPSAL